MHESRVVDPFLLVHDEAMHHRDLRRRPAEIDAPDLEPQPEGFAEAWRSRGPDRKALVLDRHQAALARRSCRCPAGHRAHPMSRCICAEVKRLADMKSPPPRRRRLGLASLTGRPSKKPRTAGFRGI